MSTTNEPTTAQVDAALTCVEERQNEGGILNYSAGLVAAEVRRLREENAAVTAELTHKIITCGVAATHPDPELTKGYPQSWQSAQADQVRELRKHCDAALSDLANRDATIRDDCHTDSLAREIARRFLPVLAVDGDSYGVPTVADIVESMGARIAALVAAGDAFRNMIEMAPQSPPETWPTDSEMNDAVTEWDSAKAGAQVPDAAELARKRDAAWPTSDSDEVSHAVAVSAELARDKARLDWLFTSTSHGITRLDLTGEWLESRDALDAAMGGAGK
jgi:hypothetical protein